MRFAHAWEDNSNYIKRLVKLDCSISYAKNVSDILRMHQPPAEEEKIIIRKKVRPEKWKDQIMIADLSQFFKLIWTISRLI